MAKQLLKTKKRKVKPVRRTLAKSEAEQLHDYQQDLANCETLIVTWRTWSDTKFVNDQIAVEEKVIAECQARIARMRQNAADAPRKLTEATKRSGELKKKIKLFKNRKAVSKMQDLLALAKQLKAKMEAEQNAS